MAAKLAAKTNATVGGPTVGGVNGVGVKKSPNARPKAAQNVAHVPRSHTTGPTNENVAMSVGGGSVAGVAATPDQATVDYAALRKKMEDKLRRKK